MRQQDKTATKIYEKNDINNHGSRNDICCL